jgi:SSS family solute:Na+ symporter
MMPIIVMLPGIAAYVLYKNGHLPQLANGSKDEAYSSILAFLPEGLKGLSVAALTAAIVASLAGKVNSISTIYVLDIHKKYFNKDANEKKMVSLGRVTVIVAMIIAIIFTWNDTLGIGAQGGFTYIQKYTGFISPGVFAMFILGMFWKRTTGSAAIAGVLTGFILSIVFNNYAPSWFGNETLLYTAYWNGSEYEIPFLISMGWSFIFTVMVMVGMSLVGPKINPKSFALDRAMFKLAPSAVALIVIILIVLSLLYIRFW